MRRIFLFFLLLCCSSCLALEPVPDKIVVLTFDDSAASHHSIVRPLLKRHGFSATFFITEGFSFRANKRDYMNWEQIAELHRDGFEIGNHTRDHMSVTAANLPNLREQVEAINTRCAEHGIPRPASFAFPGNALHPEALPLLRELGFHFARRGGAPEFPYEKGRGPAFEPGKDHPLLVPSAGDARPDWTMGDFIQAVSQAEEGKIAVLQFHGVPDREHPWVHTPPEMFEAYMEYLARHGFTVIALRDLARYVDPEVAPEDPWAIIEDRKLPKRTSLSQPAADYGIPEKPYAILRKGKLEAVIVDNSAVDDAVLPGHRAGYHGIAALRHTGQPRNPFVPAYSGINFEHIHDGTVQAPAILFEPRQAPMELRVINETTAELYQPATPYWGLESCMRYELLEDEVIEVTFECIPRRDLYKNGYIGLFWASYIHQPESGAIHFLGTPRGESLDWIHAVSPEHGVSATHRSLLDQREFAHDNDFPLSLVFNYSKHRAAEPWYLGVSHEMALAQIFRPRDQIRFSQSPSGGGRGNPAWDFQWFITDYAVGRRYQMVMRLLYRPIKGDAFESFESGAGLLRAIDAANQFNSAR